MAGNSNLHMSKDAKEDEYYTSIQTIENELKPKKVTFIWKSNETLVFHVNGMTIKACKGESEIGQETYYSVGGGAIGAAIAVPLVNLLGVVGAIILSIGVAILLTVFMFGIHTSEIVNIIGTLI